MSSSTTSPAKAARTKGGKPNGSTTRTSAVELSAPATVPTINARPSDDAIALRAYEIYERDGRQPGTELQNWLKAEAELSGNKGH
jgi:hypothetical protein